jgi:hypothetical protein
MKEIGNLEEPPVMEFLFIPREKSTMDNGDMIKLKAMVLTCILMEQSMKASGITTCNMERGKNSGQMVHYLLENIEMAKRMVWENINGQMEHAMKGNGRITKLQVMVSINGLMEENTLVIGRVTSWMNLVYTHGRMAENMKVFIKMTKSMDTESIPGLTKNNMLDGGAMVNSMGLASLFQKKERRKWVSGKMAKN